MPPKKPDPDPLYAFNPSRGRRVLDMLEAGLRPGRDARRRIVARFALPPVKKNPPQGEKE